ncbi:MAG TPA: SRPBCC domain-containing protein [Woeseiaceae bacterium]|nr:SRPBCC domain-containing protein [Woeseiaceae bacterium]
MNIRAHVYEENFPTTAERLFTLLYTPSSICQWWGASRAIVVPRADGIWVAAWGEHEDDPDYTTIADISVFQPPHRMLLQNYRVVSKAEPLAPQPAFVLEFLISQRADGASLRIRQDGFPAGSEADRLLAGCVTGWRDTFAGIRQFIE